MKPCLIFVLTSLCWLMSRSAGYAQESTALVPQFPTYSGTVLRYLPDGRVLEGTLALSVDPFGALFGNLLIGGEQIPVRGRIDQLSGGIPNLKGRGSYRELLPLPDGRDKPNAEKVPVMINKATLVGGSLDATGVVTAFRLNYLD